MHFPDSSVARRMRAVSFGLAVSVLAAPGIGLAQNASGLPEVIVTAERREASLQTVPVAVSALSGDMLKDRQITEYQDLQSFVPSLKMTNNITSPTNLSPSLRGSLQQDASLIVAESPFGIYVDDVYVARLNGNNITLNDIERVEVLRGPQGTLYGRNTLQGAIKFVSRTPGEDSWLNASAGVGNYDQYLINASGGGPFGGGFAGSLAGQYNNKDGQFSNVATGRRPITSATRPSAASCATWASRTPTSSCRWPISTARTIHCSWCRRRRPVCPAMPSSRRTTWSRPSATTSSARQPWPVRRRRRSQPIRKVIPSRPSSR